MKTYTVTLKEVHESTWKVDAETIQDAKENALGGIGEPENCEYSYTIEDDDAIQVEEL